MCFARKHVVGTHVFCKKTCSGYSLMCFARKHLVVTHWCVLQENMLWVLIDVFLQENMLWELIDVFLQENMLRELIDVFYKKTCCGYD